MVITIWPDRKGIETSTEDMPSVEKLLLRFDPIERGLKLKFLYSICLGVYITIWPDRKGIETINDTYIFNQNTITIWPDRKGIET